MVLNECNGGTAAATIRKFMQEHQLKSNSYGGKPLLTPLCSKKIRAHVQNKNPTLIWKEQKRFFCKRKRFDIFDQVL
jgi:hypothetical protein